VCADKVELHSVFGDTVIEAFVAVLGIVFGPERTVAFGTVKMVAEEFEAIQGA